MDIDFFILAVIFMTYSKILIVDAVNGFLNPYKNMIYKIHPLVLITKEGLNSEGVTLLQQDQLDENESFVGKLNRNQNMVLYCSGYFSCLAAKKEDEIDVENVQVPADCNRAEKLSNTVFEKNKIYDRRCLSPMFGTISHSFPEKRCANGRGVLVQSGFRINNHRNGPIFPFVKYTQNPFLPLYTICFDKLTRLPIFTSHELVKSKLLYNEVILSDLQMNRIAKDLMDVKFDRSAYYPVQLEITFRLIFGPIKSQELLKMFDNRKGQALLPYRLTPSGDFFYQPVKSATFMYENSVPVFSNICDGNLKKVELLGRILAVQLNRSLMVVSGAFGSLKMIDGRGTWQTIYIDNEDVPSPQEKRFRPVQKYVYKIYYDPVLRGGISFVTLNDPYTKSEKFDPPCNNIIKRFMEVDFFPKTDPTMGITVCCEIKNLIQKQPVLSYLKHFKFGTGVLRLDIHDVDFPGDLFYPKISVRGKSKFLDTF